MTNPKNIPTAMFNAINNLTKPLQIRVLKKLGIYVPKGAPGRTSKEAGINVGKIRVAAKEAADQWKGAVKGVGASAAVVATYSATDFIHDLLGIKKAHAPDLGLSKQNQSKESSKASLKSETISTPKKSNVKSPLKKPKTYRTEDGKVLTEKQYLKYLDQNKDRLAKIKKVAERIKGNKGMYIKGKKRTGHTDYRKGGMVYKNG